MKHSHVKWTGLAERLTIQEAARLVAKETGKSLDYTISFLMDCAEQGYFTADVVAHSDYANVSHISRVDPLRSTVSTVELTEWLNAEIEDAHQRARGAIARQESQKWGYEIKPEDIHVTLASTATQLRSLAEDETISMTPRDWVEYLAVEVAERQRWAKVERDAKLPVVRAEYLNLFGQLSATLPLRQKLTGLRWAGENLPGDWLTRFQISKTDLRAWATSHAPEIANSQVLAASETKAKNDADEKTALSGDSVVNQAPRVAWRDAVQKQWALMISAHGGKCPRAKEALAWFKQNDQEGAFRRDDSDDTFCWVGADGKPRKGSLKAFQNFMSEIKGNSETPD
ncbi:hypothetical protein KBK24_0119135 [Burkholderia sp. K24]|nr:hypothetical protein KBK24_0119135 [Burkholderia sp. K24]